MHTRLLCSVLAGLLLSGCSGLIVRVDDSMGLVAGKVATRALLLCPLTFCLSEIGIAEMKDDERRAEERRSYRHWVESLPPERQALEEQREHEQNLARTQALGLALMGGGPFQPFQYRSTPVYTPPAFTPPYYTAPAYAAPPTIQRPQHCTSNVVGSSVYTNCY